MKTAKLIIAALLLSVCAVASAQENDAKQAFESELVAKNAQVNSIRCRFTQTRALAVLAKPVKKAGTFYFLAPDNMLLRFDDGDYIKMTREWFEMNTAGKAAATKVASNPMLKSLNSILSACVAGDFETVSRGFAVAYEQSAKEWRVTLAPQRGKAAAKLARIVIVFDRADMSLNLLKMEEKSGDYTEYAFADKLFNVPIDAQIFNVAK